MLAVASALQAHGREWLQDEYHTRNAMIDAAEELQPFGRGHGRCNFASPDSIQALARTGTIALRVLEWPLRKFQQARPKA